MPPRRLSKSCSRKRAKHSASRAPNVLNSIGSWRTLPCRPRDALRFGRSRVSPGTRRSQRDRRRCRSIRGARRSLRMLGVRRVGDDGEKILEPWCATDVFGRTASFDTDVTRIFDARLALTHRLDGKQVMPTVAHVVRIVELADAASDQRLQLDVLSHEQRIIEPAEVGQSIALAVRLELPEMPIAA